jgi:hypothetical protein
MRAAMMEGFEYVVVGVSQSIPIHKEHIGIRQEPNRKVQPGKGTTRKLKIRSAFQNVTQSVPLRGNQYLKE